MNLSDNSLGEEIGDLKEIFNKISSLTGDCKNQTILIVACLTLGIVVIKPLAKYYLQLRYGKKKNSKTETPTTTSTET